MKYELSPEYKKLRSLDKKLTFVKIIGLLAIMYSAVMIMGIFLSWMFIPDAVHWSRVFWSLGGGIFTTGLTIVLVAHMQPAVNAIKKSIQEGSVNMYVIPQK